MTQSASIYRLGTEFDDFLFAPVGDEESGMSVSVLSALARLDVDPREEAANLAQLPAEAAIKRLTSLIAALPGSSSARADPARLITLLPHRTGLDVASHGSSAGAGTAVNFRAVIRVVVINALFVGFMLATQWMAINHHQAAQTETAHAASPTASAEMPPPSSRQ